MATDYKRICCVCVCVCVCAGPLHVKGRPCGGMWVERVLKCQTVTIALNLNPPRSPWPLPCSLAPLLPASVASFCWAVGINSSRPSLFLSLLPSLSLSLALFLALSLSPSLPLSLSLSLSLSFLLPSVGPWLSHHLPGCSREPVPSMLTPCGAGCFPRMLIWGGRWQAVPTVPRAYRFMPFVFTWCELVTAVHFYQAVNRPLHLTKIW